MLKRVDRLQIVVPDPDKAAAGWAHVLGAELETKSKVRCLAAVRHRWRVGNGRIEFLSPDGAGPVADAVARRGAHLFAAGLATDHFDGLMAHLAGLGIRVTIEAGQAYIAAKDAGDFGLQVVISTDETLPVVGELDYFYETTVLVDDAPLRVGQCADMFKLDTANFVPISSPDYGYTGTLTMFRPGYLDRFEVITPTVAEKTMGRFFSRFGQCYYMAFAESGRLGAIEETAKADGLGHTIEPFERPAGHIADTVFLHPSTLGGVMLGISRRTKAWQWSGNPNKVEAPV